MQAWRIAKHRFALDRAGTGGLMAAGRWNQLGQPVIYAGLTVEIAVLEKLVHTGTTVPVDLVMVDIGLPDEPKLYEKPDIKDLPAGWYLVPSNDESANYGAEFLRSGRALGLIVPSTIVPEASNLVINPMHPRFADVTMRVSRKFEFDGRLKK